MPPVTFAALIALMLYGADHAHRGPFLRLGIKSVLFGLFAAFVVDLVVTLKKKSNQSPEPESPSNRC